MAHAIRVEAALGCIIVRFWGDVSLKELDQVRRDIEAHPEFRPGLDRVWDERACTLTLSSGEVAQLAARWANNGVDHGRRRVAYFVSSGVPWGFNRLFESQRDAPDVTFEMFTDWAAVKDWLGLPAELADPELLLPDGVR